jgi:hypothetical protein
VNLYPKFSLRFLQTSSKYCLSYCSVSQKTDFADKIMILSSLTWRQIYGCNRHGNGFEKIPTSIIKISIPNEITNKNFVAFWFSKLYPKVGFIEYDTFYILWFDHNITLYIHE